MDEVVAVFGRRVRALRTARRMTLEELGHAAKLGYKHLSAIERGTRTPSFDAIGKLARTLDVEYWELFVADRRPTANMAREIGAAAARATKIKPERIEEFLRSLRTAVRKLDQG